MVVCAECMKTFFLGEKILRVKINFAYIYVLSPLNISSVPLMILGDRFVAYR